MNVRSACLDDLPGILEIYNEAVRTTTATYDEQPQTLEQRAVWFEDHVQNQYPVFVAESHAGSIVGWSALSRFHSRPGYRFTVENSVYVAESHRGQGIGKSLLGALLPAAADQDWRVIIALIDADNAVSLRMHAAFGFERVGHLRQVGYKFGRWLDVIYMQRLLESRF
jgi:phosphinothricin acetyltransferase